MIRIVRESADEILCFCVFHDDRKRPNMVINKTGEFAGRYHCFSCGADGLASDLGLDRTFKKTRKKKIKMDWYSVWLRCKSKAWDDKIEKPNELAAEWGVTFDTLMNYGYGWMSKGLQEELKCKTAEDCHVFPFIGARNEITGLQRRFMNDRKVSVPNSTLGIFAPMELRLNNDGLYITEGCSDTVVCADMGFTTIGRPNATASEAVIVDWCLNYITRDIPITIVRDNDVCGEKGSVSLLQRLILKGYSVKTIVPKEKDVRKTIKVYGKKYVKNFLGC
jgi:hypothetical protein